MFRIDPDTGDVFWNDYHLHIRLTHDEFVDLYPKMHPAHQQYLPGRMTTSYQLPGEMLGDHLCTLKVHYVNRHIGNIGIDREIDPEIEADDESWWPVQLKWIKTARSFLLDQFGEPNERHPASLLDERDYLPEEFVNELIDWRYRIRWGSISLSHDYLSWNDSIYVHYDQLHQIRTWDELEADCDFRIRNEQLHKERFVLSELVSVKSLITLLRDNFSFQQTRPVISYDGLLFNLREWKTRVAIRIRSNDKPHMYEIWRDDSRKRSFVAEGDHAKLIEELRTFLETKEI